MINRIALDWSQEHDRRRRVAIYDEERIRIGIRLPGRLWDVLSSERFWPEQHLLIIFSVNTSTHIGVSIEFRGRECFQDWIGGEKVIWVTFTNELGTESVGQGNSLVSDEHCLQWHRCLG